MKNYCTHVKISDDTRVDLFSPTMFRVRVSKLDGEPFDEKYEIPFAVGKTTPWDSVEYTVDFSDKSSPCVMTSELLIYIKYNGRFIVEKRSDGSRLYPIDEPVYGMFQNHCIAFDSASFHEEINNCSRYSHWFYNEETGLYDINIYDDLMLENFFIYGENYASLYKDFNTLVGAEPMLNKKGYGFHQTQHLATAGTQKLLMKTAETFRERGIPCDTLILDYEWGDGANNGEEIGWGQGFDWSNEYQTPLSPEEMMKKLKEMHYDVMVIHHSIPDYKGRNDEAWVSNPVDADFWWKKMKELTDIGVCGTWQDTRKTDVTNARIYKGIQDLLGNEKRCTFLGNYELFKDCGWTKDCFMKPTQQRIGGRRYPYYWTGDMQTRLWSEFEFQIKSITNDQGPLKGISYITNDCMRPGGTQLGIRSGQFHCFNSIARSHNAKPWQRMKNLKELNEIMAIDNAGNTTKKKEKTDDDLLGFTDQDLLMQDVLIKFLKLRYRLIPYIYTLAREAYDTGLPITRPLMIEFENDENCNKNQYKLEYMLGSRMLICPVYTQDKTMKVYLPSGCDWVDFWTYEELPGGQEITVDTSDLTTMPVFVKKGAVIPMGKEKCYIEADKDEPLYINVYGKGSDEFVLYEDDDSSLDYQKDICAFTKINSNCTETSLDIEIKAAQGSYKNMPKTRKIIAVFKGFAEDCNIKSDNARIDGNDIVAEFDIDTSKDNKISVDLK